MKTAGEKNHSTPELVGLLKRSAMGHRNSWSRAEWRCSAVSADLSRITSRECRPSGSWSRFRAPGRAAWSASAVATVPLLVTPATDRLAVARGALLDVTAVVMDAARGRETVLACRCGDARREAPLVAPGDRLVDPAADEERVGAAADRLPHLSLAHWTTGHRRTPGLLEVLVTRGSHPVVTSVLAWPDIVAP
jgi:hypothetical protein